MIVICWGQGYEFVSKKIAKSKYTWAAISKRYNLLIEAFNYAYEKPTLNTKLSYRKLLKSGHAHLNHYKLFFENKSNS